MQIKEIEGYEDLYFVSDEGSILNSTGKKLKPYPAGKGYPYVWLSKFGNVKPHYVHQIVATHFIPKPAEVEGRLVVNHKDGNKSNNTTSNLEWVSYSQNNQHAYDTGLKSRGSAFYNAKLTEKEVKHIRSSYPKLKSYQRLAEKFGVSRATIRDVVIGRTWRSVS